MITHFTQTILGSTPVTDQLTDVSSVDVMIARVVGVVLALVIAGLILVLLTLLKRVRVMAATLGQRPEANTPDDGHGKTIAAMTSLSVDQGNEILSAVKFQGQIITSHLAELDATMAKRGPIIDRLVADTEDLKATRHDWGERLGHVETDVASIKARLESATCFPIKPVAANPVAVNPPTTGG